MTHACRSSNEADVGEVLDAVEALQAFARDRGPGCYDVDEHSRGPFPGTNVLAGTWGKVTHHTDGRINMERIRWPARLDNPDLLQQREPWRVGPLRPTPRRLTSASPRHLLSRSSPKFLIICPDRESVVDVDHVEAIEPAIRSSEPGRYHANEISADPLPSGHTSRRWGVGIKRTDPSVELELDP